MSLEHSSPAPPVSPRDLDTIRDVLSRLDRELVGEPVPIASARNDNFRVETSAGPLFFRLHRKSRSRERIELGIAALLHADERGIPVVPPLAGPDGRTLFPGGGRFASVYPWLDAGNYTRGQMTTAQAASIGAVQARLHQALADFTHPAIAPATELYWDTDRSIQDLSRVDDLIRYYPAPGQEQLAIQRNLRAQLSLLESDFPRPPSDFEHLPRQPIHGDIHEGNVMFAADGSLAAVVDWDMVALGPRVYEVLRAVDFCLAIDSEPLLDAFLGAYADIYPLDPAHIAPGVELWAQSTINNTWVYRARFIEGDRRVDQFLRIHPIRVSRFAEPAYRAWLVDRLHGAAASR